jgi:hypothetical protein
MKMFFTFLAGFFFHAGFAQELPSSVQHQYEEMAEAREEAPEDDQVIQQLEYLRKHPVPVNTAAVDLLEQAGLLTPVQLQHLSDYIKFAGPLIDLKELQAVPSFDLETIHRILPFITINNAIPFRDDLSARLKGDHSFLFRLSRNLAPDTAKTTNLGDANHLLFRYRYQFKDLVYFGITGEKDAGEMFFRGAEKKGFDFYSAHLFIRNKGILKTLALGDFTVNMGQGLLQWQGFGPGKTADVISIKRSAPVLQPYRGAGEYNFFRGLGVSIARNNLELSFFFSRKGISGHTEDSMLTSIKTDGYFRTASELGTRNQGKLFSAGASLVYHHKNVKAGIYGVVHKLSIPLEAQQDPYKYFSFSGDRLKAGGMELGYSWRNLHVFGEAVMEEHQELAVMTGLLVSLDPKVDLSFLFRDLSRGYASLFGSAFTENSLPGNERGIFMGISLHPSPAWSLQAYLDLYHFPWLKFRVNAPSDGQEFLLQLEKKWDRNTSLIMRFRQKTKEMNDPLEDGIHDVLPMALRNVRIHFSKELPMKGSVNARMEIQRMGGNNDQEDGFLFYVEAGRKLTPPLRVQLRLQYFETSGFDSRIYAYESDVLYGFSIPAFYDQGFRYYINARYQFSKKLGFWFRWAETIFAGGNSIHPAAVNQNKNREVRFQVLMSI